MARLFSIRPGMSIRGRKFKGLRGWAGKPFHPPLTDFPIVAYVLAAVFDVSSYVLYLWGGREPADYFLYLRAGRESVARDLFVAGTYVIIAGAIVSLGSILTGFWDWWKGVERDFSSGPIGKAKHTQVWRTINWHMTIMLTVTAIVVVDILVRLNQDQSGFAQLSTTVLSVIAALLVFYGSLYGGSLVYDYQFNVESLEGSTAWDETEADQQIHDKPQSEW